jgi:parallel beta-helix repeat protein
MFGIELSETTGNNVVNNTFINNGLYIRWYKGDSHKNSIFNNTVNGKPLIYLQDESDLIVDDDAGQIILVTCSNITIKNQNISNATTGILLCNTHDSKILNSTTVSNSWCGIELHGSTRNTISSTTISKNYEGIYIYHSNYNMITNNLIYLNKNSGIELVGSFNTISLNNISNQGYEREVHWVGGDGINVRGARNVVRENIISNNRWGIFVGIWGSDENEIIRNVISKNEIGVVLLECEKNFVSQNNFIENLRHARFENFLLIALFSEIILEYGNLWSRNYWDDFKAVIGPKIINGKFEIMIEKGGPWGDIILHKWLRWINFDWHPAKRPYKIP